MPADVVNKSTYGAGYSPSAPTETYTTRRVRKWQRGDPWTLMCPGSHAMAFQPYLLSGLTEMQREWNDIARLNGLAFGGDFAQTLTLGTYGSSKVQGRIEDTVAFVTNPAGPLGAGAERYNVFGGSGGAAMGINNALRHPEQVGAQAYIVPLVNSRKFYLLDDAVLATTGITKAEIRSAHQAANEAAFLALMPNWNPIEQDLSPLADAGPMLLFYSGNDPFIFDVRKFAQKVRLAGGKCIAVPMGNYMHGTPPGFDYAAVGRWMHANRP